MKKEIWGCAIFFFTLSSLPPKVPSTQRIGAMEPSRPETVEGYVKEGLPSARAEAVTRYLMEAGLIRRTVQGRRGSKRLGYGADDFAVINLGFAAYRPIAAPLAVAELSDHVPAQNGPLWQVAPSGSFESLLAPLSEKTTLRTWLRTNFIRFAALTSEDRRAWRRDEAARTAFLEFITPPDMATAVGLSGARFEWGPPDHRRSQEFLSPVPISFDDILERGKPNYEDAFVTKLRFPLLLVPGNLLDNARGSIPPPTAASLPGEAAAVNRNQDHDDPGQTTSWRVGKKEKLLNPFSVAALVEPSIE